MSIISRIARRHKQQPSLTIDRIPHLLVELTRTCNLHCVMCPTHSPNAKLPPNKHYPPHMDFNLYLSILAQIKSQPHIAITPALFGDPLLSPDIFRAIALARANGHECHLTTNGMLLDALTSQKLLDLAIGVLCVSIDGATQESMSAVRKGSDLALISENTDRFIQMRNAQHSRTQIYISACRHPLSAHEIPALIDRWQHADQISITNVLYQKHQEWNFKVKQIPCGWLWKGGLGILTNGDFVPCCSPTAMSFNLGNAHYQSISETINSKTMQSLRQLHLSHKWNSIPQCAECNNWTSFGIKPILTHQNGLSIRTYPLKVDITRSKP